MEALEDWRLGDRVDLGDWRVLFLLKSFVLRVFWPAGCCEDVWDRTGEGVGRLAV